MNEYFYTPPGLITPPELRIEGDEYAHLVHVMRKGPNDDLCVVDGCGNLYDVTVDAVTERTVICSINGHRVRVNESPRDIILGVALLKHGASFDFLVEKTTELGVRTIVPLLTERTIPEGAKIDRWRKLALAAMKQSQRCVLPDVRPLVPVAEFFRTADRTAMRLIPHERTERPLLRDAVPSGASKVVLAIGPEGGFSEGELEHARSEGFAPVSLGVRRLRTETAATVAVAEAVL